MEDQPVSQTVSQPCNDTASRRLMRGKLYMLASALLVATVMLILAVRSVKPRDAQPAPEIDTEQEAVQAEAAAPRRVVPLSVHEKLQIWRELYAAGVIDEPPPEF